MTNLSSKIRALHEKGMSRPDIAARVGAKPDYVRRVLNRKEWRGVADDIRKLAEAEDFSSLPASQHEESMRDIAARFDCSLQEVRQALAPSKPMGRPTKPRCKACGQPMGLHANQRHEKYLRKVANPKPANPSNHHIDNIEIRDAEEKTNG
jgi:hypothetical protein